MSSWFAKVFDKKKAEEQASAAVAVESPVEVASEPVERIPKQRKVVHAPVIPPVEESAPQAGGIRIKAKIDPSGQRIVLMVDRPVLPGYSCRCASPDAAAEWSPLAETLFSVGGIEEVVLHEMNVTVTRDGTGGESPQDVARRLGQALRKHLESGEPVVSTAFTEGMPAEEEIRFALQRVIDEEINPGIASHSGVITLTAVKGNTAYIKMGGGCQGCAASSITLRQGVEQSFRAAMPHLGALLDETDHAAGTNPFFTQLPMGMGV